MSTFGPPATASTGGRYLGYPSPPPYRYGDCGTPMYPKDVAGMVYGEPICGCRMPQHHAQFHPLQASYIAAARPWEGRA